MRLSASTVALMQRLSVSVGPNTFAVKDPARPRLESVAHVWDCTAAEATSAVGAATNAYSDWRARTAGERSSFLHKWYDAIMENKEELAQIMTLESGKALTEARKEVVYGAGFVRWFAEEARRVTGEVLQPPTVDKRTLVLKQPIGVVAAITPWNFPNAMITRKVAPALAAGCSCVVKPAAETPLSALALEALAADAGLPEGVLRVVTCQNANSPKVGAALCEDKRVRALSFTGSTAVGKLLYQQCAPSVKRLGLELGGNAPFVIFEDADVDLAVRALVTTKVRNAGQTCISTNRVLVHEAIAGEVADRLSVALAREHLGHGLDEGVTMGPLINKKGADKFYAHVEDCMRRGGTLRAGGPDDPRIMELCAPGSELAGAPFAAPTVIEGCNTAMACWHEETFGPLLALTRFSTEEEALALANDADVGLAAYFCTEDMRRVWRFAEALEVGMVGVNEGLISSEVAPFGGVKESGLGREGHHAGLEEYLEYKYICLGNMQ